MKKKYYKATFGNQIVMHGKGENFRKGMELLGKDMQGKDHWFKCKKCEEEWQDDTFCSNGKCPNCGIGLGKTIGVFSKYITYCDKNHGEWENIIGVCKCEEGLPLYSLEDYKKIVPKKQLKNFIKYIKEIGKPPYGFCDKCNKRVKTEWKMLRTPTAGHRKSNCINCGSNVIDEELAKEIKESRGV